MVETRARTEAAWGLLMVCLLCSWHISVACPFQCTCQHNTQAVSNTISVNCSGSSLTAVPKELPAEISQLSLRNNKIASIGEEFTSLVSLVSLDISFNSIDSLDSLTLDMLENLHSLNLSQNEISTIPSSLLSNLSSLQEIDFSNNRLKDFDNETFKWTSNLEKLYLENNTISSVENSTFMSLERLLVLDLSYNNLTELTPGFFAGLTSLQFLDLSHNTIDFIDQHTFSGMVHLRTLDLSHNRLTAVSISTFSDMTSLVSLSLADNMISELAPGFMGTSTQLQHLTLDRNNMLAFSNPVFKGLYSLQSVSLSDMPSLEKLAFNTFQGLPSLQELNISHNSNLTLIHPHLFTELTELKSVDLSFNHLSTISPLTFHTNLKLKLANIEGNDFVCDCGLAWLAKLVSMNSTVFSNNLQCFSKHTNLPVNLKGDTTLVEMCSAIPQVNASSLLYFAIGSSARLHCDFEADQHTVVVWRTPRNKVLTYHAFHPDVTSHLLTPADLLLNSSYHATHYWHNSSSYYSSLSSSPDRIMLLNDGSLYIDYILRSDNGEYTCLVMNAYDNSSAQILVKLDYGVLFNVKIMSIIVGVSAALSMFLLNLIFSIIGAVARRLVNKRRREAIRKLLENMDTYKTSQFTRLRENYSVQLSRIRDQYHNQLSRLSDNYHSQMKRVRQGCSHQVVRIRDNYTTQVGRLRNYSSHQIEQIREMYNNQLLKIRDYGSLQMMRMHEKYKLQQQHVIKLLETMNLDNCKSVIDSECMRTESMIFDVDILKDTETSPLTALSGSDSEYLTASSENSSQESLGLSLTPEDEVCNLTTRAQVGCDMLQVEGVPHCNVLTVGEVSDPGSVDFVIDLGDQNEPEDESVV